MDRLSARLLAALLLLVELAVSRDGRCAPERGFGGEARPSCRISRLPQPDAAAESGQGSLPVGGGAAARPPARLESPARRQPPSIAPALQAVTQRAAEITRHGFSLAERGALYSARAEFLGALSILTQALDVASGQATHGKALAEGLRAIQESDDFAPSGSQLQADLDVASIVAAHRTPVLKELSEPVSPLAALQSYYTFAQERLAEAGGGQPAASMALYALGKTHMVAAEQAGSLREKMHGPKAMTFYRAALWVDPRNSLAANELGVLLARYGQWGEARRVLLQGIAAGPPRAEMWHNLAVVHQQLGEWELSRRALAEAKLAAQSGSAAPVPSASAIHWVPLEQFPRAIPSWRAGPTAESGERPAAPVSARRSFWGSFGR